MLCENCGLKNAVSIYMSPKEKRLKYLCGLCYKTSNNDNELENFAYVMSNNVKIDKKCKNCGLSFDEFQTTGLFGCEKCYQTFNQYIQENILALYQGKKYIGKKPNVFYIREEIKNLEQLIELCVKNGDLLKATKYGKELEKLKEENYDKLQ